MSYDRIPSGTVDPRLIDAMVEGSRKSMLRAYLLWYFCGTIGAHNFYLGRYLIGGLQAGALFLAAAVLQIGHTLDFESSAGKACGFVGVSILGAWGLSVLIDAFFIPARVRGYSERLRAELEAEADWQAA